jgi:hypothetical protein
MTDVRAIIGSVAMVLVASGATAETPWDAFKDRCLAPISEVAEANVDGLRLIDTAPSWVSVEWGEQAWANKNDNYILIEGGSPKGDPLTCSIAIAPGFESDAVEAFKAWETNAIADGSFTKLDETQMMGSGMMGLNSLQWREPQIEVILEPTIDNSGVVLRVLETDLES